MPSPVYALSIHADYRCRHSGHCCSADWDVPVELPVYRSLTAAVAAGRLRAAPAARRLDPFIVEPDLPADAAAMLQRTRDGVCVFREREAGLCIVHRDLGEAALPATCRHFPRVAVHDRRGTFVTLSHYCPTAASMLFRNDMPLAIVAEPRAFPPADYEGLTVEASDLPPLLHPRMLMDLDGYSAWEAHMVTRCADVDRPPESTIATLRRDALALQAWRPGAASLRDAVRLLAPDRVEAGAPADLTRSLALHGEAMGAVPPEFLPPADDGGLADAYAEYVRGEWTRLHAPVNRYIAAKAFASWTAYQGRGVHAIVRGLDAALALVHVEAARQCRNARRALDADLLLEAIRSADFILNHLAVGEDLAATWSAVEGAGTA